MLLVAQSYILSALQVQGKIVFLPSGGEDSWGKTLIDQMDHINIPEQITEVKEIRVF